MQEDVENRAVALAIRGTKLTAHSLKAAIAKYLAYRKNKKLYHIPTGKQTVKQQLILSLEALGKMAIVKASTLVCSYAG